MTGGAAAFCAVHTKRIFDKEVELRKVNSALGAALFMKAKL